MTTQTELQSLPDHLRDTGNPTDADLLERAAEDYSALLARNNVLRAKVEELEELLELWCEYYVNGLPPDEVQDLHTDTLQVLEQSD